MHFVVRLCNDVYPLHCVRFALEFQMIFPLCELPIISFLVERTVNPIPLSISTISAYQPLFPVRFMYIASRWLTSVRHFLSGNAVSATNKTDIDDVTEILLTFALSNYNHIHNDCYIQSKPVSLWFRTPFMARCTRYNIIWSSLSATCHRSVVFCRYSAFRHQ